MLNIVCVRTGSKYSADYVSILFDMVLRNLSTYEGPLNLWCITDDPESLPDGVNAVQPNPSLDGWWHKIKLFSPRMPWKDGERVVYFDLDVAITGRLEDLVETKGIIKDWNWPTYNSSVMVWDAGEHRDVWERFEWPRCTEPGKIVPQNLLPFGQVNGGDQEWLTEVGGWETFPPEWFRSYRQSSTWPPDECKAVIFHGRPNPHEITEGWVPEVWKRGGMTSLPVMKGVNVTHDTINANIAASVKLDVPWFTGAFPHKQTMVLVCGGPSLKDDIQAIKDHKRRGAKIVTVNNTLTYLLSHGIVSDKHVMLDARAENAEFVKGAPLQTLYLLASQCHPDVFAALSDRDVTIWHNAADGVEVESIAAPYETDEKPLIPVPGGGTVGLRAMFLGFMSGYRKLHIYGMDGSYEAGKHHAYGQALNDGEQVLDVVLDGKHYACSRWMARQAEEFKQHWKSLTENGMAIHVHGRGIIPDMAKALKQQMRAQ